MSVGASIRGVPIYREALRSIIGLPRFCPYRLGDPFEGKNWLRNAAIGSCDARECCLPRFSSTVASQE